MKQNEDHPKVPDIIGAEQSVAQQPVPHEASLSMLTQDVMTAAETEHAPAQWVGTNSTTLNAIERLNAAIDEETEKLEVREPIDFDSFSRRKNRGLLELTKAVRSAQNGAADPRVAAHLTRLRASLVRNQAVLQVHLDATREVSAIIAKSIQEVESDGTYSLMGPGLCK